MVSKVFIPKKIRVGFVKRGDCYTGKLAYIIYFDEKGKVRKEVSWNNWRDKKIEYIDYENESLSGYIFNKGVSRDGYWGSGRSVIRVYDPRDFEFEIDIDNMIGILMHSDVSKRDIVEECIYGWVGGKLVLLPTNSVEYQESLKFTELQDEKVLVKDLVKGRGYIKKKSGELLTYLGFFDYYKRNEEKIRSGYYSYEYKYSYIPGGRKHIFYDGKNYVPISLSILAKGMDDTIVDNYAELVDNYIRSVNGSQVVGVELGDYSVNNGYSSDKWYYYPTLSKIDNNRIIGISLFSKMLTKEQFLDILPTLKYTEYSVEGGIFSYMHTNSHHIKSQYNNNNDRTSESRILRDRIRELVGNYDEGDMMMINEYIEVMGKLGYKELRYVLSNGYTVKCDRY